MSAPFMQLYVADYLGDTRHLTTEQHGAYLLLLMTMWRSEGRLPNDQKKLARIAGCAPTRWSKISAEVLEFFDVDGDDLTNPRLTLELEKASEKSIKRAASGSQGGKAKALKNNKPGVANATGLPKHSSEPEPEPEREASASLTVAQPRSIKPEPADGDFEKFWAAYPAKVGIKAARAAWAKAKDRPALPVLLDALDQYRATKPPDRDWCHPSTWLNQGRWADQTPERKGLFAYEPQPANDRHARPANGGQSRALSDQQAALRVLAKRGLLPGPDEGGWDNDRDPPGFALAEG